MTGEHIEFVEKPVHPTTGSAGLPTQAPGCATTVGNLAAYAPFAFAKAKSEDTGLSVGD